MINLLYQSGLFIAILAASFAAYGLFALAYRELKRKL